MYLEFFLDTTIFIPFRSSSNLIIKLSDYFLLQNLLCVMWLLLLILLCYKNSVVS